MKPFLSAMLLALLMSNLVNPTRAGEQDAKAAIAKGIKALGGEEKLGKAGTFTWKSKGTLTLGGTDNEIKSHSTIQGLDHYRVDFEGEINGNSIKGLILLNGDKGWRNFGEPMAMDEDDVANEKRTVYLAAVPVTLVALNGKGFKVETAGDEKVGDKPAAVLKVTGPDGKDFKLFLDKQSGLPVKLEAKVVGFDRAEFTMETTYTGYKDFDGIKKATKLESKRDGEKFILQEITDFKVLDKLPPETFSDPK